MIILKLTVTRQQSIEIFDTVYTTINKSSIRSFTEPSSCDSRNLNLSPFCKTSSTSLAMWQPSVLETYGEHKLDYLDKITGPMRRKYPNSMAERELITSLTEVIILNLINQEFSLMQFCFSIIVLHV